MINDRDSDCVHYCSFIDTLPTNNEQYKGFIPNMNAVEWTLLPITSFIPPSSMLTGQWSPEGTTKALTLRNLGLWAHWGGGDNAI